VESAARGPVAWPTLTGAVSFTGDAVKGVTLTADTTGLTNKAGDPTYVWQRSDDGSAPWDPIAGATGVAYTLADADVGKYVRVVVSYSKNTRSVASEASDQVVWPALTGTVTITGNAAKGESLTAVTTNLTNKAGDPTYVWQRSDDGSVPWDPIAGATGVAYTLADDDVDNYVRVVVSYSKNTGAVASEASGPVTRTFGLVKVTFTGLPQDEDIDLTGPNNSLSWSANTSISVTVDAPETFSAYRWVLDGAVLAGETGSSLTLNAEDLLVKKHSLTVFVVKSGVEYAKNVTFTVLLNNDVRSGEYEDYE
jgi:hypothetical protein